MKRDRFIDLPELTHERLRQLLEYDAITGEFVARFTRGSLRRGDVAGTVRSDKHIGMVIEGRRILAHRLAWFYVYGVWPTAHIDHINGDPSDNRIANLRDVTHATNQQNRRRPAKHNSSGYLGVTPHQGKYVAGLSVDGRRRYLGIFHDPIEAHQAYLEAKRQLHAGCTI